MLFGGSFIPKPSSKNWFGMDVNKPNLPANQPDSPLKKRNWFGLTATKSDKEWWAAPSPQQPSSPIKPNAFGWFNKPSAQSKFGPENSI